MLHWLGTTSVCQGATVRAYAATVLAKVLKSGQSLDQAWQTELSRLSDARDQALLKEICFGVLRWYWRYKCWTDSLLQRPFRAKDTDIHSLILIGIYQLIEMRVPHYAAINQSVEATRVLRKPWAVKLVNGVLRNFQRDRAVLEENLQSSESCRYAFPGWLLEQISADWPTDWESIARASNQRPPMVLRVASDKTKVDAVLENLAAHGIEAQRHADVASALILGHSKPVQNLPGFTTGEVSVQDAGAQLAASLLQLEPNQRVLDACAAPGGKTCHILEFQPSVILTALDIDSARVAKITENLQRCRLAAQLHTGDALQTDQWWDKAPFARILLDVPCSGTGVIRRHPDIRVLRRQADIAQLVQRQAQMLENMWDLLAPGGVLLYVTCSILKDENERQIEKFLANRATAKEHTIDANWGIQCSVGRQILPGMHDMDGFYYARLEKIENNVID